ncbi:DUF2790 domain-containing protein [Pseudomonas sp. JS3066]|jgi:hypothetical protein|uniref:DUF2790 domain-containing protein n=1 Tax=unclassified Pseudomonas TaxID=196821 RepID=UPI000EAAB4BF|nr:MULTISPECIES: DUF2790 domain-containing protein [unclassified Pseudomonas]AYF87847.1 DUF2790 domain-containing protein [Pseudomonas sp. DY-1]MDH4655632.1 DUF2790 domain-containing protein [Pseudomonas sp. BN606]MRK19866.1 DUF2790 domain-containing protein [Pseudomonas sp. JG-B]WVK94586.1 DUF2790 domain-containing protein [Pseudomonas sp. JS3066]
MKALALLVLAGMSAFALAEEPAESTVAGEPVIEQYHYGMELDIAKVLSRSEISDVCGVVPAYMTYEDHQGKVHRLEYVVFGQGCSNG